MNPELDTLAVVQALLGYTSEARFIRYAHAHLRPWFPYLPDRPGYNKRLRRSGQLMNYVIVHLARACPSFTGAIWHNKTTNRAGPARSLTAPTPWNYSSR